MRRRAVLNFDIQHPIKAGNDPVYEILDLVMVYGFFRQLYRDLAVCLIDGNDYTIVAVVEVQSIA